MTALNLMGWDWVKKAGGTQLDWPWSICADENENCYLTGSFQGDVSFGNQQFTSTSPSSDLFISKMDENGNFIWTLQGNSVIGAVGMSIDYHNDFLYVTGYFVDSLYVDGYTLIGNGAWDTFVLKCTTDGHIVNALSFGGSQSEIGYGLSTNGQKVFVTGWYNSDMNVGGQNVVTAGGSDIYIITYDMDLNFENMITGNGPGVNYAYEIDSDMTHFYTIGSSGGELLFNNTVMETTGGGYLYAKNLSSDSQNYKVFPNALIMNAKVNENNELFIGGTFSNTAIFDDYQITSHGEQSDFFLAKLNSSFEVEWVKGYGSNMIDKGKDLTTVGNNAWLIANFNDTLYVENETFISQGAENIILIEFDSNGNILHTYPAGGMATTISSGLCTSPNGTLYATGWFGGTSYFGENSVSSSNEYDYDIFIAKLGQLTPADDQLVCQQKDEWHIYPNPVRNTQHGEFSIDFSKSQKGQKTISIYNIKGQKIMSQLFDSRSGNICQSQLHVKNSGIYFVKINDGKQIQTKKLLFIK